MRIFISILTTVLFFSGSSTISAKNDSDDAVQQIIKQVDDVKMAMPNSADWCDYGPKCEYVRDVYCAARGNEAEKSCQYTLRVTAGKFGADTIVFQSGGQQIEEAENYFTYGQAYNCSNKFTELGRKALGDRRPDARDQVRIMESAYAEKCGIATQCKYVEPTECDTTRGRPTKRCQAYLRKKYTNSTYANTVVVDEVHFNDAVSGKNKYFLKGKAYLCTKQP